MGSVKLFESSFYGDFEGVVGALVQGGIVSVRCQGFTCQQQLKRVTETFVNVTEMNLTTKDSALHYVAVEGHTASVEALLSWGAIVDPQAHAGLTTVYLARQEGHLAYALEGTGQLLLAKQ